MRFSGRWVRIKKGWKCAGLEGRCLGRPVMAGQQWLPVLWDGQDDPDFHKLAGLELKWKYGWVSYDRMRI